MSANNGAVIREVPLEDIKLTEFLQLRAANSVEFVKRYAEIIKSSGIDTLPPIQAVEEGCHLWVWDGIHTHHALVLAGENVARVEIRRGTRLEALVLAAGANAEHGIPRTRADIDKAVRALLDARATHGLNWSNHEIARMARCSHSAVDRIDKKLQRSEESPMEHSAIGDKNGRKEDAKEDEEENGKSDTEQEVTSEEDEETEPTVLMDEAGLEVPSQAVLVFNALPELRKLLRTLDKAGQEIERIGKSPLGACMHWQSAKDQVKAARQTMYQGRPAHVCPYCQGKQKKCKACSGRGWVTSLVFKQAPDKE